MDKSGKVWTHVTVIIQCYFSLECKVEFHPLFLLSKTGTVRIRMYFVYDEFKK